MRIVPMGPPGSGKGTQAQLLSQTLRVPHISTGELFRQHISEQSELGLLAKTYLDTGELGIREPAGHAETPNDA